MHPRDFQTRLRNRAREPTNSTPWSIMVHVRHAQTNPGPRIMAYRSAPERCGEAYPRHWLEEDGLKEHTSFANFDTALGQHLMRPRRYARSSPSIFPVERLCSLTSRKGNSIIWSDCKRAWLEPILSDGSTPVNLFAGQSDRPSYMHVCASVLRVKPPTLVTLCI